MSTLTYSTNQSQVTDLNGRVHSLDQSLVHPQVRPRRGWDVVLVINGSVTRVTGQSPKAVFLAAKRALSINQAEFTDIDLWLNLNIQWLDRLPPGKPRIVDIDRLLEIANGKTREDIPKEVRRRSYTPDDWGAKGWAMVQMYLAKDTYSYSTFLFLVKELQDWVNPSSNPSIGCGDCFKHFTPAVTRLISRPLHSQDEARNWLIEVMNDVNRRKNRRQLTKEEAYKINFWS